MSKADEIRVVELIGMKYTKEQMPKNIIINRMKYTYDDDRETYIDEKKIPMTIDFTNNVLNMKVEILEDNTEEIEELKRTENVYDMTLECYHDIEKK